LIFPILWGTPSRPYPFYQGQSRGKPRDLRNLAGHVEHIRYSVDYLIALRDRDYGCAIMKTIETDALRIAYLEEGPQEGWPVILSHGFPYDVHAFEQDAKLLAEMGARVFRPYVRGFGPTRFLSDAVMRNGQQVARALDIVHLPTRCGLTGPFWAVSTGAATHRAW
jgi:hypothetical protein